LFGSWYLVFKGIYFPFACLLRMYRSIPLTANNSTTLMASAPKSRYLILLILLISPVAPPPMIAAIAPAAVTLSFPYKNRKSRSVSARRKRSYRQTSENDDAL